ncbi:MAG: MMPL family transporter [Pseudomonadales bacterium]
MPFLINLLVARRHVLFALAAALGLAVAWGMTLSTVETTARSILSDSDPYRAEVDRVRADFPPSTSVLFAFQTDSDVFNLPALRAMEALGERYTEIEGAISFGSLTNRRLNEVDAQRYGRDYLIPLLDDLSTEDLAEIKAIALRDVDLTKSLLSKQGDMALAVVKYKATPDEQARRLEIARSVYALRDSLRQQYPQVEIYALGGVLFEMDGYNATVQDRTVLFPLVISASILLLWYCLKSLPYALCLFLVSFSSIGLSVGSFGWLAVPFNQISSLGPLVVLVIAMAQGIHIVSVYAQGLHGGLDKLAAMRESLAINLQPVTLASLTTAMGFLSLNYSSSPGIYGFGNIVAIGVLWAYLITLAALPALVLWLPASRVPKPLGVSAFIERVAHLIRTRGNGLFWGCTALIVVTLALLPLNRLDFNRYSFIDEDSDLARVMTALAEKIGNDQSLVYAVHSGEYYGITQPEFLRQVDEFSVWVEAQPEASFVSSYTDLLRSLNRSEHDDDPAWDRLPEDQLQIIDYLVGYQLVQEIEPNLEPIFNADYSAIRLVIGTSNLSNAALIEFNDRIDAWIDEHVDPHYEVLHGDNSILFARLDRSITEELIKGFALSFVLITLTLLIGLRSLKYGLVSIMPNVFPATIVFGFWGLFVGELSPYILMLFSISIGLVVDDSVHILSKYIVARRRGETPARAVDYSLDKAGSAITITTLSLAVGTFILVLSNTFHFQNVALLLTPIILVAWLLDLLFLPPLLVRLDTWLEARPDLQTSPGRQSSTAS